MPDNLAGGMLNDQGHKGQGCFTSNLGEAAELLGENGVFVPSEMRDRAKIGQRVDQQR